MDTFLHFFTCCFWPISNLEISWLTHFNTVRLAGETVKSKGYLRKRTNHGLSMQSMPESLQICWLFHVISSLSSFLLLNSRFFLEQNGTCRSSVQCFTPFGTSTLRAPMATKPPPDTTCESASCEVGKSWEIPGNPEVCWENHRIKRTFYIAMFDYQREKPVGSWASPEKYARHWGSSF